VGTIIGYIHSKSAVVIKVTMCNEQRATNDKIAGQNHTHKQYFLEGAQSEGELGGYGQVSRLK
jgi:hypothetical protein